MSLLPAHLSRIYFAKQRPLFELYDLHEDPDEFNNLIALEEHAAIEQELKTALHAWMILQEDYVPLPLADFNPFLKR